MAGPSVVVRFLADLTGFSKQAVEAQGTFQNVAGKMSSAFHGVIGSINQTGILGPFGSALDGVGNALDTMAAHGKTAGAVMAGVGAGVAGVGVALSAMGSKDQAAHQQLQAAVEATGKSYDAYAGDVDKAIKHQEHFGHTANETQDALRIMTQGMGDPQKALQYLGEAADLAAAKHESLDTAATQLTKTYNGANRLLKEFGVSTLPKASAEAKLLDQAQKQLATSVDAQAKAHQHLADVHALLAGKTKLTTAEQISLRDANQKVTDADQKVLEAHKKVDAAQQAVAGSANNAGTTLDNLGAKLKGQAAAQADTFKGRLEALKATMEDMAAKFGAKYGPAIQVFGVVMATAGTLSLAAWGWVVLIIAAVAALIAIGVLLYKNWDTIWSGIEDIVHRVWNWIKAYWPLLFGILTGGIGLAVAEIIQHFSTVKRWAEDVFNFIAGKAEWVGGVLTGIWHGIYAAANFAVGLIQGAWEGLINFFSGLPGRVGGFFAHMWDGIYNAFKGVINSVIRGWNSLHFTTPHVSVFGLDTPSVTIGVPQIPYLAEGGLITRTGLVYAHAGEAITPAGRQGPAVHIENVNLHDGADIGLLLQQIHFATMAGRL